MKPFNFLVISLLLSLISGCSWQKIPPNPEYAKEPTLPFRVGVISAPEPNSQLYVPPVVTELRNMRLFDSIAYPYHEGDPVDVVATLSVDGDWMPSGSGSTVAAVLTLGLSSPFVGASVTGNHVIKASMISGSEDIGFYSTKVTTTGEWGIMADSKTVSEKTNELQTKRLADSLAKAIREDQAHLLAVVKPGNQQHYAATTPTHKKAKRKPATATASSPMPPRQTRTAQAEPPVALRQGVFSFEAEKLAIQHGCTTLAGIRPVGYLLDDYNMVENYIVTCQQGDMRIQCANQLCEVDR